MKRVNSLVVSLSTLVIMFSFIAFMGTIDNNLPIARVFAILFIGAVVVGVVSKIQKSMKN